MSLRTILITAAGAIGFLWLIIHLLSGSSRKYVPSGTPGAVIVTVIDPGMTESYKNAIEENRKDYASRHGTQTDP